MQLNRIANIQRGQFSSVIASVPVPRKSQEERKLVVNGWG